MIKKNWVLAYSDPEKFSDELTKTIDELQGMGFKVTIQYSLDHKVYSALVLGSDGD